jgi:outer membrane biogenesis lipoprotein LolB
MKIFLIILFSILLTACSDSSNTPPPPEPEKKAYNPWHDQMKVLDQAKQMEGQVQKELENRDRLLREQGG